jgi:hypothetical protein
VRIGTNNTLIETYPPKFNEIPSVDIPKSQLKQAKILSTQEDFNFLGDEWIYF